MPRWLAFYGNVSCIVFEIQWVVCRKSQIFPIPCVFGAPVEVDHVRIYRGVWCQKTKVNNVPGSNVFVQFWLRWMASGGTSTLTVNNVTWLTRTEKSSVVCVQLTLQGMRRNRSTQLANHMTKCQESKKQSLANMAKAYIYKTRYTFCEKWQVYLPHSWAESPSSSSTPISCMTSEFRRFCHKLGLHWIFFNAYAQTWLICTSGLKFDVTVVFLDPNFLCDAGIPAIRGHLRQNWHIYVCTDFQDLSAQDDGFGAK